MFGIIKKETLIVIFYVLYFSWLFTVTYMTADFVTLNYFALFIAFFYFLFLREKGDYYWFILGVIFALILPSLTKNGLTYSEIIKESIFWLPITWGTTVVALRKLVLIVEK
jgi:hypothetical protein